MSSWELRLPGEFIEEGPFPCEVEEIILVWFSGIAEDRWGGLGMRIGMFATGGRPLIN